MRPDLFLGRSHFFLAISQQNLPGNPQLSSGFNCYHSRYKSLFQFTKDESDEKLFETD
jgi:hypothetical protein